MEHQAEGLPRKEADGAAVLTRRWSAAKSRGTPTSTTTSPVAAVGEGHQAPEEASPERFAGGEKPIVVMPMSGESAVTLDTPSHIPAWPWPRSGQFTPPVHTA